VSQRRPCRVIGTDRTSVRCRSRMVAPFALGYASLRRSETEMRSLLTTLYGLSCAEPSTATVAPQYRLATAGIATVL